MPGSDRIRDQPGPQRIDLGPGTHAIFGYGSLLSVPSLERTLGRTYTGPFVVCGLAGWRRSWDVGMPNRMYFVRIGDQRLFPREILYLNIRRVPDESMTGVLFVVSEKELLAYDRREWIYDRIPVTGELRGVELNGGQAWAYTGKPEYLRRDVASWRDAAIRTSYLHIVDCGLSVLGQDVRAGYEQSTDPLPRHLVFADEIEEEAR